MAFGLRPGSEPGVSISSSDSSSAKRTPRIRIRDRSTKRSKAGLHHSIRPSVSVQAMPSRTSPKAISIRPSAARSWSSSGSSSALDSSATECSAHRTDDGGELPALV